MSVVLFAGGGLLLLLGGVASLTGPGILVLGFLHWFLEFYVGVFSLVALSIAVMMGVAATDRLVLTIKHRILLQTFHRSMAVTSVVCLFIHIVLKVLEAHAYPLDAVVPFVDPGKRLYIGLGTVAGDLMLVITWTGIIRGRFAGTKRPGMWRALHATAYMAWPFALLHGLLTGRSAKPWVIVSYLLCVLLVFIGLLIRGGLYWGRRVRAPKATTTGAIKPVGKLAPLPPVAVPMAMEPILMERAAPRRQLPERPRPADHALPTRRRALDESRIISAGPPSGAVAPRRARHSLDDDFQPRGYGRDGDLAFDYDPPEYPRPPAYPDASAYPDVPAYGAGPGYPPEFGYDDPVAPKGSRRRAPIGEPADDHGDYAAEAPPRRRRRSLEDLSDPPPPAPSRRSRRAAEEISDEEFWAHMRGEALR